MGLLRARRVVGLVGLLVLGVLLGGLSGVSQSAGTLVPEELIVGANPSRAASILQPPLDGLTKMLLDYVQKNGFPEVKRARAVVAETYPATVEAIGAGKIHVGVLAPLLIVQTVDRYGVIPINVTKRGENLRYRSQFMAHFDGPHATLLDLVETVKGGKTVKFSYAGGSTSVSGFLFACKTLKDYGILPGDYRNFKTVRTANHQASVIAIYKKDVDVGVGFEGVQAELDKDQVKKELGWKEGTPLPSSRIVILGYSDWIPNDGIVAIKEIKPELRKVIQDGFSAIMKTEEGKKFGDQLINATDFLRTPQEYDMLGALKAVRVVANEIEPNLAKCENQ